jgi:hypothetical protein
MKSKEGKDFWNQGKNGITGYRVHSRITPGQTKSYRKMRLAQQRKAKQDEKKKVHI